MCYFGSAWCLPFIQFPIGRLADWLSCFWTTVGHGGIQSIIRIRAPGMNGTSAYFWFQGYYFAKTKLSFLLLLTMRDGWTGVMGGLMFSCFLFDPILLFWGSVGQAWLPVVHCLSYLWWVDVADLFFLSFRWRSAGKVGEKKADFHFHKTRFLSKISAQVRRVWA